MQSEPGDKKNVENHNMSDQSQQDKEMDLNKSKQEGLAAPKADE